MQLQGAQSNIQGFFGAAFQTANMSIQSSAPQQLQQLSSLLQGAFQNLFQAGMQAFQQLMGGLGQTPAAPGQTPPPSQEMMQPSMPPGFQNAQFLGGAFFGGAVGGFGGAVGGFGGAAGGIQGGFGVIAGGVIGGAPPPSEEKSGIIQNGPNSFVTPGGFTIKAEGKDMAWTITNPEGKTTRIWGDPHVDEADGRRWDFKKDMSFVLPDGTKISAKTVPWGNGDATVTGSIDIMNGNQRATISGIDKNKPSSSPVQNDRWATDARTPDGQYAVLHPNGKDWFLNGKQEITGGNAHTGEIFTKGGREAEGLTGKSQNAMREPFSFPPSFPSLPHRPQFGGQNFMNQLLGQVSKFLENMFKLQESFQKIQIMNMIGGTFNS